MNNVRVKALKKLENIAIKITIKITIKINIKEKLLRQFEII